MSENILSLKNITKIYQAKNGETKALDNINLDIKKGEFVSIIGPSGCGKSTLLSIIAGLEDKNTGKVYLEGKKQKEYPAKQDICYKKIVYQNGEEYVKSLLKKYHLYEFKDKYPTQLSGGMRQRAALIRTLAIKPKILLLDEAFSALDYQTRIMVTKDVYGILREEGITALIVTHDISESISLSDRVVVLSRRPAKIKNIHEIKFDMENRTPINCRERPEFSKYFDLLWNWI